MPFLTGRVSFLRFRTTTPSPPAFDSPHIDALAAHAIPPAGTLTAASTPADGISAGWTAGDHIHDTAFSLHKNAYPDHLHFALCVERDRLPADKLKAYTAIELAALVRAGEAANPAGSGLPSARQKREAKEAARDRLEEEAKDGRFRKRQVFPVLWDRRRGEVLFGATAATHVGRFASLFEKTFGVGLEVVTAGRLAVELDGYTAAVEFAKPSAFVPDVAPPDVAWIADDASRDWLGNEFLLWLWYYLDVHSDTLTLSDGSDAAFMFARTLLLDCPRGQSGRDAFAHEGPARLPEARRAIQAGKLPRRAGVTIVRHDRQYEFTLHAESFAVASGKLPPADDDVTDAREKVVGRFEAVGAMLEAVDLVYRRFLEVRLGEGRVWEEELAGVRKWLGWEERKVA